MLVGLGFNIIGGKDTPHLEGDNGIFIAKIREQGAAAENGVLQEGDRVILVSKLCQFIQLRVLFI